jgi:hypothetical protein
VAVLIGVALVGRNEKISPAPTPARAAVAGSRAVVTSAVEPALSASAAPVATAASVSAVAGAARPSFPPPRRATGGPEEADELGLVTSMQLALRSGNAAQALALANEHARRFPGGYVCHGRLDAVIDSCSRGSIPKEMA